MSQPKAYQFERTDVGGYASLQQGDRQVINTIHIATAYFTMQEGLDLLSPETALIKKEQFENVICGHCGCRRLISNGSGRFATTSVAERSEPPIRDQKLHSLESPAVGLRVPAESGARLPLDNTDKDTFDKPAFRHLQASMLESFHYPDPRGAWADLNSPVPTRTEVTHCILPTDAIHNSHSDVTEGSSDLQLTPTHILDKKPT